MFPQGTQSPRSRARCPLVLSPSVTLKATAALHTQLLCWAEIVGSITFHIIQNYLPHSYRCFVMALFLKRTMCNQPLTHLLRSAKLKQQITTFSPQIFNYQVLRKKKKKEKHCEQTP